MLRRVADLLGALPSLHRADGEAEPGRARDVWNVHVVVQPLVPPRRKNTHTHPRTHDDIVIASLPLVKTL